MHRRNEAQSFSAVRETKREAARGLPLRRKLTNPLRRSARRVCFQFLPEFRFAMLPLNDLFAPENFAWRRNFFANPC
jgi:hypothetical protein